MKPTPLLLAALAASASLHAATWTVDNNEAHPADFREIQDAVDAAAMGDTILVAGSAEAYDGIESTKRLHIKGPGPNQLGLEATIGGVHFTEIFDDVSPDHLRNASGSLLEGLIVSGISIDGPCSSVTIKRCDVGGIDLAGCSGSLIVNCRSGGISLYDTWHEGNRHFVGTGNNIVGTWSFHFSSGAPANTLAENCIFGYYAGGGSQSDPLDSHDDNPPFTVRNSILISKNPITEHLSNGVFDHCLLIGASTLPAENGNLNLPYTGFSTVFENATVDSNPRPEAFVLKAGSPALGAGLNGADLGIFGGVSPFVPGLIPALPRITYLAVPPLVPDSTGLTFEVQAEARD